MRKLWLALAAGLALSGCNRLPADADFSEPRPAQDGWIVEVSVDPSELGPLAVSVGPTKRLGPNDSRAWLEHGLVFTNTGNRPITFADSRTGEQLGPRREPVLLVADQGCGYARYEGRIELACLMYLDIPTLGAHSALTRTVTLWKGLRGMAPLGPGTYVFRKNVRFAIGRTPPAEDAGRTATLRIVYQVEAA